MYKSIVFDLGGVMVDFAPRAYLVDRICNEEIEEQVYDLTFGSEEWKQLDAGLVSRFDGNQAMLRNAKAAGRRKTFCTSSTASSGQSMVATSAN